MKRISIALLMAALLCVATACDITPGSGLDGKVAIRFAVSTGNEEGDDEVLRSAGVVDSETQTVSLGGDLFLYATLRPAADELRAAEVNLAEGQKVWLSAYTPSGTLTDQALYTYAGGRLISADSVKVEPGTYNFTAHSYYNNTTDTPGTTAIDPDKDLVWGQQTKTVSATDRTLTIVMKHLFSQVRVNVKTTIPGAMITAIGATTIANSYADLTVHDGAISKGAALTHNVTFPDNYPTDSINGNETHVVYPPLRLNMASMTVLVSGISTPFTLSNLSFVYNNLLAGKRYVLEVSVKRTSWARSNIYWQSVPTGQPRAPGYLTFDVTDLGHQGYQGVFFRWGSLVGVSPAQTNGSSGYSTATPVYIPTYVEGGTSTWSVGSGATNPYSTLGNSTDPATDIPYLDGSSYNASPYGIDNTYVIDAARNTTAMYDSLRGDICQYLGKTDSTLTGYRLAIQNEMVRGSQKWNTVTPTADGWIKGDGSFNMRNGAGYADGRADFLAEVSGTGYDPTQPTNGVGVKFGAAINQELGVMFPASGLRSAAGGGLGSVGLNGYSWSCSAVNATNAWELLFSEEAVGTQSSGTNRGGALPVRCIRE
jgi:hypothetical protein